MQHEEYVRILPEADTAVLFIHGIVGTPNHFRYLLPLVQEVPEEYSVYDILLPGHGGSVEAFGRSGMKQWKEKVWKVFGELAASHERVIIAGHSMGTLFAMQLALENPEKVPYLFLVAAPMRPGLRLFGVVNVLRLAFGKIREDHPLEVATRMVCGVDAIPWLWKYIPWIPRFFELFREIYITEKQMGGLTVPCVAYQSRKDELVTNFSRGVLVKSGVVEVHELMNSTHFYYDPEESSLVCAAFREVLRGIA